jgi:hypothetical protein
MKKLHLILIIILYLITAQIVNPATETTIEAQVKALEARVELLEAWAVRFGGRIK